jgi:sialate O-acetylesterase
LIALAKSYGRKGVVYSGPQYKAMKIVGKEVHISFDHLGGGLVSRDGKPLTDFTIAGSDGRFYAADAKIVGDKVVVSSSNVGEPVAVRFAWNETAQPNLANKVGLPAVPFRTGP